MLKHKCRRSLQDGKTYSFDTTVVGTLEMPKILNQLLKAILMSLHRFQSAQHEHEEIYAN